MPHPFEQPSALTPVLGRVLKALEEMPAHTYPEKSENQAGKDILQSMLNEHIRQALTEQSWECEVPSFTTRKGIPSKDRCDLGLRFGSSRFLMEVEFGNGSSNERNLLKFQAAYLTGELDFAIYVTGTSRMTKRIDSGLTVYETTCAALNDYPEGLITCPLVVIGLDVDDANIVDWSQSGVRNPTVFSGTNGKKENLFHFVEEYRNGVVLPDITLPQEPSVLNRVKAVSRKVHSAREKKAAPRASAGAEQLALI